MQTTTRKLLNRKTLLGTGIAGLALATTGIASAQSFDSGSSGDDGAFVATPEPGKTEVEFDPRRIHRNNDPNQPLIDPERDNVFHFTTFTVPAGVTLRMSARWTNGPVYILVKGLPTMLKNDDIAVRVTGTINLSGEDGADMTHSANRGPAFPGPGGYYGGLGGNWDGTTGSRGQNGLGPFGGLGAPNNVAQHDGHRGQAAQGLIGGPELVPLVGGSGGGGGNYPEFRWYGGGGGGGGGALLISSNRQIYIDTTGRIYAGGGHGGQYDGCGSYFGGGGAAGSVRLVAPILAGDGQLHLRPGLAARGNCTNAPWSAPTGRVRLEAFQNNQTYNIQYGAASSHGSPLSSFVPATPPPVLRVSSVDGQPVAANPTGSFDLADVTINDSGAVEITITAQNVPVVSGPNNTPTVPTLYLFSLEGKDLVLDASKGMTALAGNFANSTATVSAVLPPGFSRGYVRASWTVP
ncbi:MAG TPA: hypothetical protein VHP33_23470 [Polyangiaceae bacterium]|nr:hypothetical protein [Polyangiaceae bacterium]